MCDAFLFDSESIAMFEIFHCVLKLYFEKLRSHHIHSLLFYSLASTRPSDHATPTQMRHEQAAFWNAHSDAMTAVVAQVEAAAQAQVLLQLFVGQT